MQGIEYKFLRHHVLKGTIQVLTAAQQGTLYQSQQGIVAFLESAVLRADGAAVVTLTDTGVALSDSISPSLTLAAGIAQDFYPNVTSETGIRIAPNGSIGYDISGSAAGRQVGFRLQIGLYLPIDFDKDRDAIAGDYDDVDDDAEETVSEAEYAGFPVRGHDERVTF